MINTNNITVILTVDLTADTHKHIYYDVILL